MSLGTVRSWVEDGALCGGAIGMVIAALAALYHPGQRYWRCGGSQGELQVGRSPLTLRFGANIQPLSDENSALRELLPQRLWFALLSAFTQDHHAAMLLETEESSLS